MKRYTAWFVAGPHCPAPAELHPQLEGWLTASPSYWQYGPSDADKRQMLAFTPSQLTAPDGGAELSLLLQRATRQGKALHAIVLGGAGARTAVEAAFAHRYRPDHGGAFFMKLQLPSGAIFESAPWLGLFVIAPAPVAPEVGAVRLARGPACLEGEALAGCCLLEGSSEEFCGLLAACQEADGDCLVTPPVRMLENEGHGYFTRPWWSLRARLWQRLRASPETLPPLLRYAAFCDHPLVYTALAEGGRVEIATDDETMSRLIFHWPATAIAQTLQEAFARVHAKTQPMSWQASCLDSVGRVFAEHAERWHWHIEHRPLPVRSEISLDWDNGWTRLPLRPEGRILSAADLLPPHEPGADLPSWIRWLRSAEPGGERATTYGELRRLLECLQTFPADFLEASALTTLLHQQAAGSRALAYAPAVSALFDQLLRPATFALQAAGYECAEPGRAWHLYLLEALTGLCRGEVNWFFQAATRWLTLMVPQVTISGAGEEAMAIRQVELSSQSETLLRLLVPPPRLGASAFCLDRSGLDYDFLG